MPQRNNSGTNGGPTAIDCFAGCGGMTEGLKRAGFRVVGAIELDVEAAKTFLLNHRQTHLWNRDIRDVSAKEILEALQIEKGDLDLLGGCPPCQGFSTLRTKNGAREIIDDQNELIFEFERLVKGLRPKHVMLENVPALFTDQRLKRFRTSLSRAGYRTEAKVLDVAGYGVPQRRRRLVLLASRVSAIAFAPQARRSKTVRDAIGSLPPAGSSGDPLHDIPEQRSSVVRERIKRIPPDGGSRSSLPESLRLACHKRSDGFKDVYGRMAWDSPSPTITTGCFNPSKGRFLHPEADRAITMREAALLQSFPRRYRFPHEIGKTKIATMIGNALPPTFIHRHAKAILKAPPL